MDGGISGQRLLDVLIAHVFAVPASIAPGDVVEAGAILDPRGYGPNGQ